MDQIKKPGGYVLKVMNGKLVSQTEQMELIDLTVIELDKKNIMPKLLRFSQ